MTPLICPQCQRSNPVGDLFCTGCGTPLPTIPGSLEESPAEDRPQEQAPTFEPELRDVRRELREVRLFLDRLQDRLAIVDQRLLELGAGAQSSVTQDPTAQSVPPLSEATATTAPVPPWVERRMTQLQTRAAACARAGQADLSVQLPRAAVPDPHSGPSLSPNDTHGCCLPWWALLIGVFLTSLLRQVRRILPPPASLRPASP